jgi:hypothetical protein
MLLLLKAVPRALISPGNYRKYANPVTFLVEDGVMTTDFLL